MAMSLTKPGGAVVVADVERNGDGGRGGIRTHGTVTRTSDFESGAFNHSATLPLVLLKPTCV